jgi:hypothetical protein
MSKAYIDNNGVARWESNGRVIPADCVTPEVTEMPGFNFKATFDTRKAETDAFLAQYRATNRTRSHEEMSEAYNELGPGAVDVLTGKSVFTKEFLARAAQEGVHEPWNLVRRNGPNARRRQAAAPVLSKIENGATVTFPYNGQQFTATVDKINQTTATVTITKVEGRSNNPRQRPILPGAKGVRVPASILARSL